MNKKNRVLIIGDAMLDIYIYGQVERLSPEAPVPVICLEREMRALGGAANVARNTAALGAEVSVVFVLGKDEKAAQIKEQLAGYGISCDGILQPGDQQTINKTRVVGNGQQLVRIDYHDRYVLHEDLQQELLERVSRELAAQDIVVISDYGKGTCTQELCRSLIAKCKEVGKPVIVDPKGNDWEKYRGATLITPNMKEINQFSGKNVENTAAAIEADYGDMSQKIGIDNLLITRSAAGMSLLNAGGVLHIPAQGQEVYDVSGAGDTVVATLAALLTPDLSNLEEVVHIANLAAGIVVAKPGTAMVTMEEIQARLADGKEPLSSGKIYTLSDYGRLKNRIEIWKAAGKKVVTTNGCFDLLHKGHIKLLHEAKKQGDKLIVAINSDRSVKRLKGESRPVNTEMDRAVVLAALDAVDAVVIFDPEKMPVRLSAEEEGRLTKDAISAAEEAPMALMQMIRADVHVKGGDYRKEDVPEAIFADKLVLVDLEEGYSTTGTIKQMKEEKK